MSVFFIAEVGVNHNGDLDTALAMIDVAVEAGADAVKFQTFKAEKTVLRGTDTVAYQQKSTQQTDQFALLKELELTEDEHVHLVERCALRGIEFMSTAFDPQSLDFLVGIGVKHLKVPSGEVTNIPFLRQMAAFDLKLILSTGMATLAEVKEAVDAIAQTREVCGLTAPLRDVLSILHCTSAYPTPVDQLNMRAIRTLSDAFDVPVGYSDHSEGTAAALVAVALGAQVYEKHFTLDKTQAGPDHAASLEPDELARIISEIRTGERMLGDGIKVPQPCELQARDLVRRSLMANRAIAKGEKITAEAIDILRPASGLHPRFLDVLVGSTAKRTIAKGEPFVDTDVKDIA